MDDELEILRNKLHMLLVENEQINKEEILSLSQELDKLILKYYSAEKIKEKKLA